MNRRSFLQWTAAAGGTLAAGWPWVGGATAAASPSRRMRFGLVTYQWGRDWDLPTLIANCQKTGLLGVELRVDHRHGVSPRLSAAERRQVRRRFEDSPVTCVGMGTNEAFHDPDPQVLQRHIDNTKAWLRLSHDIGGSGVKVKPNDFVKGVSREKTIEQIGRSLNEVAAYGADLGQQIRLEVHGQCAHLPTIHAIMQVADHPNATVCWNCNGEDLEDGGLEANFNLVKDRLGDTVHLRELNVGSYPYPELIRLLLQAGYGGWVLLEARTNPSDRVAAMIEQRRLFEKLVAEAQT